MLVQSFIWLFLFRHSKCVAEYSSSEQILYQQYQFHFDWNNYLFSIKWIKKFYLQSFILILFKFEIKKTCHDFNESKHLCPWQNCPKDLKKIHPKHKYSVTFVTRVGTTRLLVYQGKTLNVPTVPYFISKSFREKIIENLYFLGDIKVGNVESYQIIRPIR